MSERPVVIVDPHFRKMSEIFSPAAQKRLLNSYEIVWGKDDPMDIDALGEALPGATAIICADWRYGEILASATCLKGILTVSGGFPRKLDFDHCFSHNIRVLSAAPGFARPVAEMALGLALAAARDICAGDRAMHEGNEQWLHAGTVGTFMLFDKPVGF